MRNYFLKNGFDKVTIKVAVKVRNKKRIYSKKRSLREGWIVKYENEYVNMNYIKYMNI